MADIVESHAVLFPCSSTLQSSFLSLLYHIKYHDTVQWSVQSIAALGLLEKHKLYHIHWVCTGRKSRTSSFKASKIMQQNKKLKPLRKMKRIR
ncbi:hypothetical protein [Chryseobacterium sp. CT-SW4]|uniref:hypothetical protein n=1 Tax=Chryseobacterium sp. SW-1 TaxID=3157343 RepID=UPI003B0272C3